MRRIAATATTLLLIGVLAVPAGATDLTVDASCFAVIVHNSGDEAAEVTVYIPDGSLDHLLEPDTSIEVQLSPPGGAWAVEHDGQIIAQGERDTACTTTTTSIPTTTTTTSGTSSTSSTTTTPPATSDTSTTTSAPVASTSTAPTSTTPSSTSSPVATLPHTGPTQIISMWWSIAAILTGAALVATTRTTRRR